LVVDSTEIKTGMEKLPFVTNVVIKIARRATREMRIPTPSAFIKFMEWSLSL
jgi:hypothetical protein